MGSIPGYDSRKTTDAHSARVALLQQLTGNYLRSVLYPKDSTWPQACAALRAETQPLGLVDCNKPKSLIHRSGLLGYSNLNALFPTMSKTVLITGTSSGIGKAAATARGGYHAPARPEY